MTGSFADFRQSQLHAPDLAFTTKTEFTTQFEFLIQTFLFESTTRRLVCFGVVASEFDLDHDERLAAVALVVEKGTGCFFLVVNYLIILFDGIF